MRRLLTKNKCYAQTHNHIYILITFAIGRYSCFQLLKKETFSLLIAKKTVMYDEIKTKEHEYSTFSTKFTSF